ncbi:MAG: hypothetical protein A2902_02960 [Elusimicrobia bacterium RIFCSPLOWO2_01_FULL_64_13]|nr:MAG: hypothetical protein A2636_04840 [Elusimicrobia bacterium RIFCSPHIGHO2_01_FULL_64_10]OGR95193.1 MAG: hypothetical protein A2902_02960 [Elusimicrobia bacterium RIFCSPLOWO2_01_FULL_64_13]
MKFRRARKEDVPRIYSLVLAATRRGKILKRSYEDVSRSAHHFWVAEAEGEVVACCAVEIYSKKLAEVRSLAVAPGHEKKGMASRLVDRCVRDARQKGIYEVLVITNRENIFKRHGFSEQLHGQKALFLRP